MVGFFIAENEVSVIRTEYVLSEYDRMNIEQLQHTLFEIEKEYFGFIDIPYSVVSISGIKLMTVRRRFENDVRVKEIREQIAQIYMHASIRVILENEEEIRRFKEIQCCKSDA